MPCLHIHRVHTLPSVPFPHGIVSAVIVKGEDVPSGELAKLKREDPHLMEIITFIETGTMPAEEKSARPLALSYSLGITKQ